MAPLQNEEVARDESRSENEFTRTRWPRLSTSPGPPRSPASPSVLTKAVAGSFPRPEWADEACSANRAGRDRHRGTVPMPHWEDAHPRSRRGGFAGLLLVATVVGAAVDSGRFWRKRG